MRANERAQAGENRRVEGREKERKREMMEEGAGGGGKGSSGRIGGSYVSHQGVCTEEG